MTANSALPRSRLRMRRRARTSSSTINARMGFIISRRKGEAPPQRLVFRIGAQTIMDSLFADSNSSQSKGGFKGVNMSQKRLLLSFSLILLAALQPARLGAAKEPGCSSQNAQQTPTAKTTEPKVGQAPPTLEQILDKYVKALGGKAALQAPTSRVMKGTIEAPAIGAEGAIEIYAKAPNKQLTEVALSMAGNPRTGFNGATAWREEYGEAKELTVYPKRDADFYLPLKLRELYPRIELKGKEKLGAREVYRLEAPRLGNPRRWYFDTESGLLLRVETRNSEGNLLSREDYEDYRAVDGIRFPFTIRQLDQDQTETVVKYSEIKHNVPLDDPKFNRPAAKSGGEAPAPQTKQAP